MSHDESPRKPMSLVPDELLQSDRAVLSANILRVLRFVLQRMRAEGRKSWRHEDLIKLLDTLLEEVSAVSAVASPQSPTQLKATAKIEPDELPQEREDCIELGKNAFSAGTARSGNPYPEGNQQRAWWDIGWHDAERAKKTAHDGGTAFHSGRDTGLKKTGVYYKIQLKSASVVSEWNEPLHQYADEGQGSLFHDYDEAQSIADRLAVAADGIVSVITVKG